jgi:hypothetical protein
MNTNESIHVDKLIDHQIDFLVNNNNDEDYSIEQKPLSTNNPNQFSNEEEEEELSLSQMDISLTHFDVQLQVNQGQLQQAVRYGVFSSDLEKINLFKTNQSSQTTEMDMENGNHHKEKNNGYSQYRNNNNKEESMRNNRGSANPNRNNNNSRR